MAAPSSHDRDLPRPDLVTPLVARSRVLARGLCAPREPAFGAAHTQTLWLVLAALTVLALGQWAVLPPLRGPVTAAGVALAVYAAARTGYLVWLERRQLAFEPAWLAERSAWLRDGEFEVLRCLVDGQLRQLTEVDLDQAHWVQLDFTHSPAGIERIRLRAKDVRIETRPGGTPTVRFPEARYGLQPSARTTFWRLGASAVLTLARPADPAAARAGTGNSPRPAAAHPAGARRPGTA
ncbi:hypothetical protein [Crossiella sp. CA198]|uniref:hypothetical protein n=1 Tax=Crossiella sp. CA198 TaxID=3455607 RepID=UPI003F8D2D9E